MTTTLTAEDPRLARLRPEHAAQLGAIIGESEYATRQARLEPLMGSIGLARIQGQIAKRTVCDPASLDDEARRVLALLSELEVDLSHYPVYSQPSWLRQWLGVEPRGVLFQEIDDGGTKRLLIDTLRALGTSELAAWLAPRPIAEQVEVLVELLDGDGDFHTGTVPRLLSPALPQLDGTAGTWAVRVANAVAPPPEVDHGSEVRERAIFVALARAKVPIEPRWDPLVPLSFGSFARWAMEECLAAIPAERRAAAVLARLERANRGIDPVLKIATEALAIVPDPAIARWILGRWDDHGRPKDILESVRAIGEKHPAVKEVASAPQKQLALVPRALAVSDPLDEVSRGQLEALRYGAEEDEPISPPGLRRYVLDRDGRAAFDVWLSADSGIVFLAGKTDVVAEIVQGGLETKDPSLRRDLRLALVAAHDLAKPKALKKPSAKTKTRSPKKPGKK